MMKGLTNAYSRERNHVSIICSRHCGRGVWRPSFYRIVGAKFVISVSDNGDVVCEKVAWLALAWKTIEAATRGPAVDCRFITVPE